MSEEEFSNENSHRFSAKNASLAVKYIIIANILFFGAQYVFEEWFDSSLVKYLALYNFRSEHFQIYQLVTHMFLHASLIHIFFNMFILWMFGSPLENIWSSKKFIYYYFFTGIGAGLLHLAISSYSINQLETQVSDYRKNPGYTEFQDFVSSEIGDISSTEQSQEPFFRSLNDMMGKWEQNPGSRVYARKSVDFVNIYFEKIIDRPSIGASGAVFGILLAFGLLFPNVMIYVYFLFPIKAKYFVIVMGVLELYLGLSTPFSNVANFAHIGGMIFGFVLLKIWGEKPLKTS